MNNHQSLEDKISKYNQDIQAGHDIEHMYDHDLGVWISTGRLWKSIDFRGPLNVLTAMIFALTMKDVYARFNLINPAHSLYKTLNESSTIQSDSTYICK
ncbi:MAG TPA: hypothetical protein PLW93_01430 [Candidatus Absconditabacterales bacterium]|nr:hypothetical protein [Candidatus Absconditabacterales bacterium]HNG96914.1 hypothetical protein [Candidatus Absconditabacterales bacterium]